MQARCDRVHLRARFYFLGLFLLLRSCCVPHSPTNWLFWEDTWGASRWPRYTTKKKKRHFRGTMVWYWVCSSSVKEPDRAVRNVFGQKMLYTTIVARLIIITTGTYVYTRYIWYSLLTPRTCGVPCRSLSDLEINIVNHARRASPRRADARLGSVHARNYRECRKIETAMQHSISTAKGCIKNKSRLIEEKENTGIRFIEPAPKFGHPAHDDEQYRTSIHTTSIFLYTWMYYTACDIL